MSSIIRVLSEHTINQIAAGEVVENPASVVKELLENALDAGAKNIFIDIQGGGFGRILISDDGTGMNKDDARLCVERYATSKIKALEDLYSLKTMGFRGEALASIAAISKMSITTSKEDGIGVCVEIEGGKILSVKPAPRKRGTTLEIRSLFYNVPARKKFQKSPSVSSAEISKIAVSLALANPDVSFTMDGLEEKVKAILAPGMSAVKMESGSYKIWGFAGGSRPNRTGQYTFVNKRFVVSSLVSYAVKAGFGSYLDEMRHPNFVLHIEVREDLVDVNVHPQKSEVKFAEEEKLKEILRSAIQSTFVKKEISYSFSEPLNFSIPTQPFQPTFTEFVVREEAPLLNLDLPFQLLEEPNVIGLYKHFLLLDEEGLLFVDLNLARQRVLYESRQAPSTQRLLFPLTVQISLNDVELAKIKELGLELHRSGPATYMVEAIPHYLKEDEVFDLLHEIQDSKTPDPKKLAVRFSKKTFSIPEAIALYKELQKSSDPAHSPEGKPISFKYNPAMVQG